MPEKSEQWHTHCQQRANLISLRLTFSHKWYRSRRHRGPHHRTSLKCTRAHTAERGHAWMRFNTRTNVNLVKMPNDAYLLSSLHYTNTHIDDNRKYYIFSKIRLTLPVSLTFIIYWIILTKLIRPSLPHPWHPTDLVSPLSLPDRRPLAPFTIQTHSRKLQHKYIAFPSSSLKRPRFPLRSPERSYPGLFPSPHAISL